MATGVEGPINDRDVGTARGRLRLRRAVVAVGAMVAVMAFVDVLPPGTTDIAVASASTLHSVPYGPMPPPGPMPSAGPTNDADADNDFDTSQADEQQQDDQTQEELQTDEQNQLNSELNSEQEAQEQNDAAQQQVDAGLQQAEQTEIDAGQ
jgi:hypothetical protein